MNVTESWRNSVLRSAILHQILRTTAKVKQTNEKNVSTFIDSVNYKLPDINRMHQLSLTLNLHLKKE